MLVYQRVVDTTIVVHRTMRFPLAKLGNWETGRRAGLFGHPQQIFLNKIHLQSEAPVCER